MSSVKRMETKKVQNYSRSGKSKKLSKLFREWQLFVLLLPALAALIVFRYLPMGGLILAFKKFNVSQGIFGSPWNGAEHFIRFFSYYRFGEIFSNTILLSVYKLAACFPLPIILAISLNEVRHARLKKTVQTITYAPYFISVVVIVGIMTQILAPQTGLVNNIISRFGGQRINFLGEPGNFRHLFVWSDVWQMTGYTAILYIAVLTSIDMSMYEAAEIDGATKWHKILYIDIPSIMPTIVILLILDTGRLMDVSFEKVILLQNNINLSTSEVISTYLYKVGILDGRFDFATAGTLFNSVINFTLLLTVNKIAKRVGDTSLW